MIQSSYGTELWYLAPFFHENWTVSFYLGFIYFWRNLGLGGPFENNWVLEIIAFQNPRFGNLIFPFNVKNNMTFVLLTPFSLPKMPSLIFVSAAILTRCLKKKQKKNMDLWNFGYISVSLSSLPHHPNPILIIGCV